MNSIRHTRHGSLESHKDGADDRKFSRAESLDFEEHRTGRNSWSSFLSGRRPGLLQILVISTISLLLGASFGRLTSSHMSSIPGHYIQTHFPSLVSVSPPDQPTQRTAKFHLLYPINNPSEGLCKVLLGASILGYPRPTLINWGETFNHPTFKDDGSHLAKISGTLNYLKSFAREEQDDLVLLVDALDAWFQLRPSVLVERFHDINRRANDRIRQRLGPWNTDTENIRQRVVISSQKACWPVALGDPGCASVPDSILPPRLFGPKTDTLGKGPHTGRYRFLNSGGVMGTVGDLIPLFQRAEEYLLNGPHDYQGSDQGTFADIFGEQEVWRTRIAARGQGTGTEIPSTNSVRFQEGQNYEFGVGLDYESLLVLGTNGDNSATRSIRYNDPEGIIESSKTLDMEYPHVGNLPGEISRSEAPFSQYPDNANLTNGTTTPKELGWSEVPLFAQLRTGYTPAIVHYNGDSKARLASTWNQLWYQPYARSLLAANKLSAGGDSTQQWPMATLYREGEWYSWVAERADDGVLRTDKGQDVQFEDICRNSFDVLFQDQRDYGSLER